MDIFIGGFVAGLLLGMVFSMIVTLSQTEYDPDNNRLFLGLRIKGSKEGTEDE